MRTREYFIKFQLLSEFQSIIEAKVQGSQELKRKTFTDFTQKRQQIEPNLVSVINTSERTLLSQLVIKNKTLTFFFFNSL